MSTPEPYNAGAGLLARHPIRCANSLWDDDRVRVLFCSIGAIGHVYPMMPLARALLADGHEVRWASSADLCRVIDEAGIPTVTTEITDRAIAEGRAEGAQRHREAANLTPDELTDHIFPWAFGELIPPAMLRDLLPVVKAWRPQLVVHDHYVFAGPVAAATIGAPHVTHSLGPRTPEHLVSSASERASSLWEEVGCEPRPYGGLYDHLYLDIYPPSIQPAGGDYVGRCQLLRPVPYPPPDGVDLPDGLAANADRPLVFVTFGTQVIGEWSLRLVIDAISALEVRVLVTVGKHGDPDSFGAQPPGVVIERFVPTTAVLPHAAAVVDHAGPGIVLATLGAGLPQLCLPHNDDQPLNARAVADAGAGLALDIDALDEDRVARALTSLLAEPQFVQRAQNVAAEIADMPGPDEVALALGELA